MADFSLPIKEWLPIATYHFPDGKIRRRVVLCKWSRDFDPIDALPCAEAQSDTPADYYLSFVCDTDLVFDAVQTALDGLWPLVDGKPCKLQGPGLIPEFRHVDARPSIFVASPVMEGWPWLVYLPRHDAINEELHGWTTHDHQTDAILHAGSLIEEITGASMLRFTRLRGRQVWRATLPISGTPAP